MSRKSAAVGTGAMALSPLVDMVDGIVDWKHDVDKTDNFFKIFVLTLSSFFKNRHRYISKSEFFCQCYAARLQYIEDE